MYYRSVNRGVFLTSPGRYTIALVMALGMIAIASSYNGIYLAVSLGMSILIVSGLLSEKVMKYYELEEISPVVAEPHTPFSVHFRSKNHSNDVNLYGIETLVLPASKKTPRITEKMKPLMRSTVVTLGPGQTVETPGSCTGLKRGLYLEFLVLQRTLYPFGLLAKFKLSSLPARIAVLPMYDEPLGNQMRQEIQRRISGSGIDQQFHSHRPFTSRESLRNVDWKKSAGRSSHHWVLKIYEAFIEDFGVMVDADWATALALPDEKAYESHLSRLRTACDVVRETGRRLILTTGDDLIWSGYDDCVNALVEAPEFPHRRMGIHAPRVMQVSSGTYLPLVVTQGSLGWGKVPVRING